MIALREEDHALLLDLVRELRESVGRKNDLIASLEDRLRVQTAAKDRYLTESNHLNAALFDVGDHVAAARAKKPRARTPKAFAEVLDAIDKAISSRRSQLRAALGLPNEGTVQTEALASGFYKHTIAPPKRRPT